MITFREFLSSLFDLSLSVFELRNQPLQISVNFLLFPVMVCNAMIYNTILFKKIIYLKFYLKNCFSVAEESKDYGKNPFNTGYFWKLDGTDKDVRYHACKENIILHFVEGFNFPKKKVSCN